MGPAAFSVLVHGIYSLAIGLALALVPKVVLRTLRLEFPNNDWLRGVGAIVIGLGVYYTYAAVAGLDSYFVVSILVRYGAFGASVLLVLFSSLPRRIVFVGLVDALMASWTLVAL